MSEMISFGAGVNSVAMTIMLVNEGWRGPIVFADPGAEHPDTYCYIEYFEREWLRRRGLEVTQLSPILTPDLYIPSYRMDLPAKCINKHIVPLMMTRWCTVEYKRRPMMKWARQQGIDRRIIGISYEERHRAERSNDPGADYPLVDRRIDRNHCRRIIAAEELAVPPKSGCWLCPFQKQSEWRGLYNLRPDLFAQAAEIERVAMEHSADGYKHEPSLGVHCGMTLAQAGRAWTAQLELPMMPEPEYEYQMCECRL